MNLCHVILGRFPWQGQLDVEVLSDGRVHDATCQDVRETTVITRAPVGWGEDDRDSLSPPWGLCCHCRYLSVYQQEYSKLISIQFCEGVGLDPKKNTTILVVDSV